MFGNPTILILAATILGSRRLAFVDGTVVNVALPALFRLAFMPRS